MAISSQAIEKGQRAYPGNFTCRVFLTCLVAGMGGLMFGYDIGISGGVTSMPSFLKKFFPSVYKKEILDTGGTNQYCKFDDAILTLFTSSLYLAALIASLLASFFTRKFGRKFSMVFGGALFLCGAAINGFAANVSMLIVGRILLGVGIGFTNQAVPVYLSEMAPYKHRGALNMFFQMSTTVGILAANVVNYFTAQMKSGEGWRISLGCAGLPALIFFGGSIFLPDTPNSLIERGRPEEALTWLRKIRGVRDVDEEYQSLVAASEAANTIKNPWTNLRQRKYRPQLTLVTIIPICQQLTGMNVFMFYAPVLFKTIGFGSNASLMSSMITGGVNVVATVASILTVDSFGRRALFLEGGVQMFLAQLVITIAVGAKFGVDGNPGVLPKWYALLVVIAICVYVPGFAWSWGPLTWLVPSEILPLEIRSAGQSLSVAMNMIFTFLVAELFLKGLCYLKFGLFIMFSVFVFMMSVFIYKYMPETKSIPMEEMHEVWKKHPVWKKYVMEDEIVETDGQTKDQIV